ncbi:cysteine-rich receptor-like protein kinase 2 isoform X2 [Sesbania bispinosa]|nr:cysteine-rich receptor-like protein kinase 2 isoform X2 [Sesbania bispinosa]
MRAENYSFFNEYTRSRDRTICGNTTKKSSSFQAAAKQAVLRAVQDAPNNKGYVRGMNAKEHWVFAEWNAASTKAPVPHRSSIIFSPFYTTEISDLNVSNHVTEFCIVQYIVSMATDESS